jgi:hypothetical protein
MSIEMAERSGDILREARAELLRTIEDAITIFEETYGVRVIELDVSLQEIESATLASNKTARVSIVKVEF